MNPKRKAKRTKAFKAYIGSAAWKKLRLTVFERDGWRCTALKSSVAMWVGDGHEYESVPTGERCPEMDDGRTGLALSVTI